MPLPIIVLGLKVHFTRILLRAVEGGLPRRKIEKREINKEGLWGVPSNSGIAVRNFPHFGFLRLRFQQTPPSFCLLFLNPRSLISRLVIVDSNTCTHSRSHPSHTQHLVYKTFCLFVKVRKKKT